MQGLGVWVRVMRLCAVAGVATAVLALPAQAIPMNYGDFIGTTVNYIQVTEDSPTDPTPLFGMPSVVGDTLDFDPLGFASNSSGAGGIDITDGQLLFDIWAQPGQFVDEIMFSEAGDYTLFGTGTAVTAATVALAGTIDVHEIDGVAVVGPPINIPFSGTFSPSGGTYDLIADPGVGINWSGDVSIDVTQHLIDNAIPFVNGATKVTINLDNILTTASEFGTLASIQKKDFDGFTITVIPEPSTAALLALGLLGLAARRRA